MTLAPSLYPTAMLARLDCLIEREILRLRARYQLSLDEFRGLYISDEQVDQVIANARAHAGESAEEPPLSPWRPRETDPRWSRLVEAFALSAIEEDLVLLALAPELDLKYETLYAYLNNDVGRKWLTCDLARRLLANHMTSASSVSAALSRGASLRRHGLLQPVDPPNGRSSQLNTGFTLHPTVARFLCGLPRDNDIQAQTGAPSLGFEIAYAQNLAKVCASGVQEPPVLLLTGSFGSGRRELAATLAQQLELPLCMIDLGRLRRSGVTVTAERTRWMLEQRLEPAVMYVHGIAAWCDGERRLQAEVQHLLDELSAPLLLACDSEEPWRDLLGERRVLPIPFEPPGFLQRRQLWRRHIDADGDSELAMDSCAALADRFALNEMQIRHAVDTAHDLAVLQAAPQTSTALLHEAARLQSQTRLGSLAGKVATKHGWDDLVLPADSLKSLKEIAAAIHTRHVVYADWGFARRIANGTGLKVLFAGASGTGKTMAAGVIAREVGLELYRIDLSGVVSKYIGETEKNLDRIFSTARAGNAILFFDEADAVFGKRSDVKDAHDRYANIETAYLLQKVEEHDGVVILASNLKRNIDEAFARRMHYVVDFPQPDIAQRERLWRGMFPAEAPLADDIDFDFLARGFELAGGDIRNVVLDAAFLAANDSHRIGMPQLVQALARQWTKQGRHPSPADFQRYYPMLREESPPVASSKVG